MLCDVFKFDERDLRLYRDRSLGLPIRCLGIVCETKPMENSQRRGQSRVFVVYDTLVVRPHTQCSASLGNVARLMHAMCGDMPYSSF